jgi:hypothetical protein
VNYSFDVASPDTSTAGRATTTIAPQALLLLNSEFMEEQSAAFAERLLNADGADPARNVTLLFRLAPARAPTAQETKIALDYLERNRQPGDDGYRRALARLCKVALNLNELVNTD